MRVLNVILVIWALAAVSCGGSQAMSDAEQPTTGAAYLHITPHDGYTEVRVDDPWHPDKPMAQYALVPRDSSVIVPDSLTAISVPLKRCIVYSMVHTAALNELGCLDAVVAVADPQFFAPDDPVTGRLADGSIASIGSSLAPMVEKIIAIAPDAIILSPEDGVDNAQIHAAGIPVVYMADYLEHTPLARAEWIKFIGLLTGREALTDSIYETVCHEYCGLRDNACATVRRPTVLTERPYMGVWYLPGGASYKAQLIADAGATYVFSDNSDTGSLQLSEEAVIAHAGNADIWLLNEQGESSPDILADRMPHCRAFAAFPNGIYYCDASTSPMFRDIAFHPERILRDMIYVFHPELRNGQPLRYYKPLAQ